MAVMPDPLPGLHDHEIEAEREVREVGPIGQPATIEQAVSGGADPGTLTVIDGLLRQPERTTGPPADLDDDKGRRGARVDRHEIELAAADMDVPGQDQPASSREPIRDESLGGITRQLGDGTVQIAGPVIHAGMVAATTYPPRIGSDRRADLQRFEVERIEHRVVGHDRHEFARQ